MSKNMRNIDTNQDLLKYYLHDDQSRFPFRLLTTGIAIPKGPARFRRKNFEYCTVEYVLDGQGFLEINGFTCRPQKGDVYILHKHSRHDYYPHPKDPWKKFFFSVDGLLMEQLLAAHSLTDTYYVPNCKTIRSFKEIHQLDRVNDPHVHRKAALIFHQILTHMHTVLRCEDRIYPSDVLMAKTYLDSHMEAKASLAELTKLIGKSKPHLIRIFRKTLGQTPYEYLISKRLEYAKLLLMNTALPIKKIAARLVFADEYYFSNFFKKRIGLSPRQFRKQL